MFQERQPQWRFHEGNESSTVAAFFDCQLTFHSIKSLQLKFDRDFGMFLMFVRLRNIKLMFQLFSTCVLRSFSNMVLITKVLNCETYNYCPSCSQHIFSGPSQTCSSTQRLWTPKISTLSGFAWRVSSKNFRINVNHVRVSKFQEWLKSCVYKVAGVNKK